MTDWMYRRGDVITDGTRKFLVEDIGIPTDSGATYGLISLHAQSMAQGTTLVSAFLRKEKVEELFRLEEHLELPNQKGMELSKTPRDLIAQVPDLERHITGI